MVAGEQRGIGIGAALLLRGERAPCVHERAGAGVADILGGLLGVGDGEGLLGRRGALLDGVGVGRRVGARVDLVLREVVVHAVHALEQGEDGPGAVGVMRRVAVAGALHAHEHDGAVIGGLGLLLDRDRDLVEPVAVGAHGRGHGVAEALALGRGHARELVEALEPNAGGLGRVRRRLDFLLVARLLPVLLVAPGGAAAIDRLGGVLLAALVARGARAGARGGVEAEAQRDHARQRDQAVGQLPLGVVLVGRVEPVGHVHVRFPFRSFDGLEDAAAVD